MQMDNRIGLLLLGLLVNVIQIGCAEPSASPPVQSGNEAEAHGHSHAAHGPHGGDIIDLGDETYHAEVLHDGDSVTVYLLDSSAEQAVAVSASEVRINVSGDDKPAQYILPAEPEDGEADGTSSRFRLQSADLTHALDDHHAHAMLIIEVDGKQYRGEVGHADHGHGHDDDHEHDTDHAHDDDHHEHGDAR